MIPISPIAALTPMPAFTPLDRPLHDCDVFLLLEDGSEVEFEGFEVGLERVSDIVGSATFQPLI